jgi:hypothetical protein
MSLVLSCMKAWTLRFLGLVGAVAFGALFVLVWARPVWLEEAAKDFIAAEVRRQVHTRIEALDLKGGDALSHAAAALQAQNELIARAAKAKLVATVDARIDAALAQIRNLDCECRAAVTLLMIEARNRAPTIVDTAGSRLTEFVHMKYARVVEELTLDLRIFTAINALACLLLLVLSFARPRAIDHLLLPGVLLMGAVVVSSYCYLFEQNWFYTVVYSNYYGFVYFAFLACIFALLLDIFLNRGKVTVHLGNFVLNAVGSAFTLTPC